MTIKQFSETEACLASLLSTKVSYLIFGGQGSLFIRSLEYCPGKKQLKLVDGCSNNSEAEPVTVGDILIFPKDTEILIEGYPGDDTTPLQWETPDNVEYLNNTIDFQRFLSDEEHKILFDAREELYGIMETLKNKDIPDEEIKKIFTTVIKDI